MSQCMDSLSSQTIHVIDYKTFNHSFFAHFKHPKVQKWLFCCFVTIKNHFTSNLLDVWIFAKGIKSLPSNRIHVLDAHYSVFHTGNKVALDGIKAPLDQRTFDMGNCVVRNSLFGYLLGKLVSPFFEKSFRDEHILDGLKREKFHFHHIASLSINT